MSEGWCSECRGTINSLINIISNKINIYEGSDSKNLALAKKSSLCDLLLYGHCHHEDQKFTAEDIRLAKETIEELSMKIAKSQREVNKFMAELAASAMSSIHESAKIEEKLCWCDLPEGKRNLSIISSYVWIIKCCPICGKPRNEWREK